MEDNMENQIDIFRYKNSIIMKHVNLFVHTIFRFLLYQAIKYPIWIKWHFPNFIFEFILRLKNVHSINQTIRSILFIQMIMGMTVFKPN